MEGSYAHDGSLDGGVFLIPRQTKGQLYRQTEINMHSTPS